MNTTSTQDFKIPGFKVVPKQRLHDSFDPSQSACYVLLGRHGPREAPRERVLLVEYLDHFVDGCERRINDLWDKHRVPITHVAVKIVGRFRRKPRKLAATYERAVEVQHLRDQLHPRFRRV